MWPLLFVVSLGLLMIDKNGMTEKSLAVRDIE